MMFLHAEAFGTREEADARYQEITKNLATYPQLSITVISLSLDDQPLIVVIGEEPPFTALESPNRGRAIALPKDSWKALIAHHQDQHRKFAMEAEEGTYTQDFDYGQEGRGMFGDGTLYPS